LTARVEAASAAHGMVKYSSEAKRNIVPNIDGTAKKTFRLVLPIIPYL
jgi:hypothetical protein